MLSKRSIDGELTLFIGFTKRLTIVLKLQFFKKAPFQTNNPNRHEEEEEEQLWSKL
jgi:hypothetical protein